MKMTSFTDYSLRLMMYIAVNQDRLVSIKEVAEIYGISRNHLMKIVHELGKGGYLETVRGKNGGFKLAMPARDINIGQLVRYTENDLNIVECFNTDDSECIIVECCVMANLLKMALNSFFSVLDRHNLAELTEGMTFTKFNLEKPTKTN